ncbi:cytochrome c maturation protein CcmE [Salipaludibacillus agaradhaerens]|uniref:cytochrome c maturation protein CcmE n=1 Tax=Salipaludibacillus agaradhaerens TaxID=76935 RepID=UPI002150CF1E|nr:cytochrome c maturation protein CcmE [Salipaludibacillus agaradhaerens]MCR6116759.1 cytochrome c maturation protein CcmE [Salipaludibacillus agaradhaerens]UJW55956.1 cytochrome c maturation protein CcmE [Bacillus sp. A116_S68]
MKKNTKVILAGSLIFMSILVLLITATPTSSGAEVPINHLNENGKEYEERYITTEGFLIENSVVWNADAIELQFDIQDEEGHRLSVYYHGVQPDNFSDDVIVIVHGYVTSDGIFEADKVQTRCPSVYEGEDPEDYDPDIHREMDRQLNIDDD